MAQETFRDFTQTYKEFLAPGEVFVEIARARERSSLPGLIASWYRSLEVTPQRGLPKRLLVAATTQRVLIFDAGGAMDGRPQRIVDEAPLTEVSDVELATPWSGGGTVSWKARGSTYRLRVSTPRGREMAKALRAPSESGAA